MATAAIPIRKIRVDSTLGASLSRSSALPPFLRKPLKAWLFPHVLRFINSTLAGDRLGQLTAKEAGELYPPLFQFHLEVTTVLAKASERTWIERKLIGWWIKAVRAEADKLGDIVEALAWGSDQNLRGFIRESISEIETFRG